MVGTGLAALLREFGGDGSVVSLSRDGKREDHQSRQMRRVALGSFDRR